MNGGNIIVKMNGVAIAATKVNKINTQCDQIEVSSPTQGKWKDYEDGRIGWSINTDFLIIASKYIDQIGACLNVGKKYTLTVCDNMQAGAVRLQGMAMLRVCDIQFAKGSLASGVFQFVGCGELEEPQHLVEGITLSPNSLSLLAGTADIITATVLPEDALNKSLSWSSSDTSIATVDSQWNVTALSAGTCTITASATDGSGVTATCQCQVNAVPVTGITLSDDSLNIRVNQTSLNPITAEISPSNATNKTLSWSSSDQQKMHVEQNGDDYTVVGYVPGSYSLIASATDGSGVTATCPVTVWQ